MHTENRMYRKKLEKYISETYNADAEHPWAPETDHTVFRHSFAVIMEIPKAKLGIVICGCHTTFLLHRKLFLFLKLIFITSS